MLQLEMFIKEWIQDNIVAAVYFCTNYGIYTIKFASVACDKKIFSVTNGHET